MTVERADLVVHVRQYTGNESSLFGVDVAFDLVNCTPKAIVAWELRAMRAPGESMALASVDPRNAIPSHSKTTAALPLGRGKHALVLEAESASGERVRSPLTVVRIVDDALEEALARCTACGGTFGAYGIGQRLMCNCKTRDAGRPCRDGIECESVCLATGGVEIADHAGSRGAPRGYRVGRCSATTLNFGCLPRLDDGITVAGPKELPLSPVLPSCSD